MPKKKGSKKKKSAAKKSKLTPEEQQIKDDQERTQAEEQKKKEVQLTVAYLKEKLEQEQHNASISRRKIDEQWRLILRKAKTEELRKELVILSQNFERVLDRKDAVIQTLLQDMAEAEQQQHMAMQSHIQNLDRLFALQEMLVREMHEGFNAELQVLKDEFLSEREAMITQHESEITDIKDILFAMQLEYEDTESEMNDEFHSKRDDIRTKNLEARSTLKATLEGNVGELWEMFEQARRNYEHSTADKRAEFERLREKDRVCAATIDMQSRKLNRLQEQVQQLKTKLTQNQKESEQRNRDLKQEKETTLVQFQRLKAQMTRSRNHERENLAQLTVESKEAMDVLEHKLTKAEKILKQAEMCRKLETEQEKVLPFYEESITQQQVQQAAAAEGGATGSVVEPPASLPEPQFAHATAYAQTNTAVAEYEALDNFWKRYNKVLLEQLAVEKERETLDQENAELRNVLKQYLDGISVSEEVLGQDNTLLVINGRTNAPSAAIPVGDGRVQVVRPTVVEASHVINTTHRMAR